MHILEAIDYYENRKEFVGPLTVRRSGRSYSCLKKMVEKIRSSHYECFIFLDLCYSRFGHEGLPAEYPDLELQIIDKKLFCLNKNGEKCEIKFRKVPKGLDYLSDSIRGYKAVGCDHMVLAPYINDCLSGNNEFYEKCPGLADFMRFYINLEHSILRKRLNLE